MEAPAPTGPCRTGSGATIAGVRRKTPSVPVPAKSVTLITRPWSLVLVAFTYASAQASPSGAGSLPPFRSVMIPSAASPSWTSLTVICHGPAVTVSPVGVMVGANEGACNRVMRTSGGAARGERMVPCGISMSQAYGLPVASCNPSRVVGCRAAALLGLHECLAHLPGGNLEESLVPLSDRLEVVRRQHRHHLVRDPLEG